MRLLSLTIILCFLFSCQKKGSAPDFTDLILDYHFNDEPNMASVKDNGLLGNNSQLFNINLNQWVEGINRTGVQFVATQSSYMKLPISLKAEDKWSISFWAKADSATSTQPQIIVWQGAVNSNGYGAGTSFVASNHEFNIALNYFNSCLTGFVVYYGATDAIDNATCASKNASAYLTTANAVDVTAWNHVVVSVSGANTTQVTIKLYVNGVFYGSSTTATEVNRSAWLSYVFVARPDAAQRFFNGTIDSFKIYSRELNQSEISSLYKEFGE